MPRNPALDGANNQVLEGPNRRQHAHNSIAVVTPRTKRRSDTCGVRAIARLHFLQTRLYRFGRATTTLSQPQATFIVRFLPFHSRHHTSEGR
eukprot:scaffold682_cov363-Pavlova_lutheri.AAC.60